MLDANGRDFYQEAHDRVKGLVCASDAGRLTAADIEAISGKDVRPALSCNADAQGYLRCAVFTCTGVLNKSDRSCGTCRCRRADMCRCDMCATPYDVNRQVVCGVCERCLPHALGYEQQRHHDSVEAEKSGQKKGAVTIAKLTEMLQRVILLRVPRDKRGHCMAMTPSVQ